MSPSASRTSSIIISCPPYRFGITYLPSEQRLDFYTLDYNNRIQTLKFPNIDCEENQWNKIHFSVLTDRVTLYHNCQKRSTIPIDVRSPISLSGDIWLAKYEDDLTTVPLDLQYLVVSCDPTRPERESCAEFVVRVGYHITGDHSLDLHVQSRKPAVMIPPPPPPTVPTPSPTQPTSECPICPPGPPVSHHRC